MIDIYFKNIKQKELTKINEIKKGAWIKVTDPDKKEIRFLKKYCDLDSDYVKDALDPFEVPRVETEKKVTYVFTRIPSDNLKEISTVPILIAITQDFIISIAKEDLSFFKKFKENKVEFSTTQKIKFFILLFSEINRNYNNLLVSIMRQVKTIRVRIKQSKVEDLIKFVDFEKIINEFLSALVPTNAILHKILNKKHLKLYPMDEDLVEDLLLSNRQLIEVSQSTLKNIVNLRSAYSTIMNQELNSVIKLLTIVTIILTVPTIITSFFGMNVNLPLESTPQASLYILLINFGIIAVLLLVFFKKKWL
jgi:magnesium transporter